MAEYPLPPWLRPADAVGPYVQGLHLGAQLQQERQRLAAQASEAATRAALQQQQMEQESMLAQQRMEVARAQAQQEIGLKQQELAQRQQTVQLATEQAARKYEALQAYQSEIGAGGDPLKAILKYGPAMGTQSSAEAAAIRASQMAAQRTPGALPNVPIMKLGSAQEEFAMFPSATGAGYRPVRLGTQAAMTRREMEREALKMEDKQLQVAETAHRTDPAHRNATLTPKELKKQEKEFPGLTAKVEAWKQEDKTLKDQRADLMKRMREAGGRRGVFNPKTGTVDWNVGTLPSDMTQIGAPAGGGTTEETEDEGIPE